MVLTSCYTSAPVSRFNSQISVAGTNGSFIVIQTLTLKLTIHLPFIINSYFKALRYGITAKPPTLTCSPAFGFQFWPLHSKIVFLNHSE